MSFLDPCHWTDFGHLSCGPWEDTPEYDDSSERRSDFKYDKYYYYRNLEEKLIEIGIIEEGDQLTIKHRTEKAYLLAVGDKPLFWVPKKLIQLIVFPDRAIYINKCFDIQRALNY